MDCYTALEDLAERVVVWVIAPERITHALMRAWLQQRVVFTYDVKHALKTQDLLTAFERDTDQECAASAFGQLLHKNLPPALKPCRCSLVHGNHTHGICFRRRASSPLPSPPSSPSPPSPPLPPLPPSTFQNIH